MGIDIYQIAQLTEFLKLTNPEMYNVPCFRCSAATIVVKLVAKSGTDFTVDKKCKFNLNHHNLSRNIPLCPEF